MKLDLNDPRLTAFALGELDEADRAIIEQELRTSDAARQAIEEIRQTAGLLKESLKQESKPILSEEQRSAIEQRLQGGRTGKRFSARQLYKVGALAAAASLFVVIYFNRSGRESSLDNFFDADRNNRSIGRAVSPPSPTNAVASPTHSGTTQQPRRVAEPSHQQASRSQLAQNESVAMISTPPASPIAPGKATGTVGGIQVGEVAQGGRVAGSSTFAQLSPPSASLSSLGGTINSQVSQLNVHARTAERFLRRNLRQDQGSAAKKWIEERESSTLSGLDDKQRYRQDFNTEAYDRVVDNSFLQATQNPLSTFSIDVDTAAYANLRRFLTGGMRPPKDAVRIEELVNYFAYDYLDPSGKDPFSTQVDVAQAPWNLEHRLVRIGLKGREIAQDKRPPSNLVFLIDVSGSMQPANKLPLIKRSLPLLVEQLKENDRVAIVVYAGASGLVLPSTSCDQKAKILAALENLEAGGSTNGGAGIQLAYDTAVANFIKGGTNRVILATDGDFNIGLTNQGDLVRLIEERAKGGVFLSVLGFGMGNLKDSTLEKLADKGNGNYAYVDTLQEARRVLVEQMGATLITIAKDVKIQVEFNPATVGAYRLIGYENRLLRAEDFNDDTKDAGEVGAGHTVTALYEVVPAGKEGNLPGVDALKYQKPVQVAPESKSGELLTVKLRYKEPEGETSKLLQLAVSDRKTAWTAASRDFKFASAVAAFGMILRDSPYKGNATFGSVLELATEGKGADKGGYRAEFIELVRKAQDVVEGRKITN